MNRKAKAKRYQNKQQRRARTRSHYKNFSGEEKEKKNRILEKSTRKFV